MVSPARQNAAFDDELPPVERSSLAERVTGLIRQAIVRGRLPPGEPISLREVASRLGVSATPVREALFQLRAIGLVEFLPGQVRIAVPTPAALRDAFELREALEGMAARLAASRRTAKEADEIARFAALSQEASEKGDAEAFRAADVEFHQAVARAAHSAQVERYTMNALDLALTLRNLRTRHRFNATFAFMHTLIADAIRRGDGGEAERLSREHVRNVCDLVTSFAQADPTADLDAMRKVPHDTGVR